MIRIKIHKNNDSNRIQYFIRTQLSKFKEHDIEFSDSLESYDYELISQRQFHFYDSDINVAKQKRNELINSLHDNIIIIDDEDSPTMHSYKDFISNSKVKLVLKNFLLTREQYKIPTVFGGILWFQDINHPLYTGYEFTDVEWNKIQLSGLDLGHYKTQLGIGSNRYNPLIESLQQKNIDIFAIFKGNNTDRRLHDMPAGEYYTKHRTLVWHMLSDHTNLNKVCGMLPNGISNSLLYNSKICISPYGMGEFCYRDFESVNHLTALIKPDVSHVRTLVNFFIDGETYFKCKHDFSDLLDIIDNLMSNDYTRMQVAINAYNAYYEMYSYDTVIEYMKTIIKTIT